MKKNRGLFLKFSVWISPFSYFRSRFMRKNLGIPAKIGDGGNADAIEDSVFPLIYIFVNPTSGGNAADSIFSAGGNQIIFTEEGVRSKVYVFNIRDGEHGYKPGFQSMKKHIEQHEADARSIHAIIAGGDGTVMWAICEAQAHGIDMSKLSFGVIPYGTGNDLARSLGWGGTSPGKGVMRNDMKGFKALIREYLRAEVVDFDIWKIQVKVSEEDGLIKQVRDRSKVAMKDGDSYQKILTKPMCNYFSVGVESRIGLGFDKNRTKSTFRNKMRYGIEGFKKMFLSTPKIADLVDSCTSESDRVIFETNAETKNPVLIGNPVSLIFLNISSFAGGCDLWSGSTKSGILVKNDDRDSAHVFGPQSSGDGKLDILTYSGLVGLSLEQSKSKILGGNGKRIGQETGPLVLHFRRDIADKRTYMQIDGEFFTLEKVESIAISHNTVVKVLRKKKKA